MGFCASWCHFQSGRVDCNITSGTKDQWKTDSCSHVWRYSNLGWNSPTEKFALCQITGIILYTSDQTVFLKSGCKWKVTLWLLWIWFFKQLWCPVQLYTTDIHYILTSKLFYFSVASFKCFSSLLTLLLLVWYCR